MNKSKLTAPWLLTLAGAAVSVVSLFLPVAGGGWISFMGDISMIGYLNMCMGITDSVGLGSVGAVYAIFVIALIVFLALSALFALLKKPVASIVFGTLAFGVFMLQSSAFSDAWKTTNGAGFYLYLLASAVMLAGNVWLVVAKHSPKSPSLNPQQPYFSQMQQCIQPPYDQQQPVRPIQPQAPEKADSDDK